MVLIARRICSGVLFSDGFGTAEMRLRERMRSRPSCDEMCQRLNDQVDIRNSTGCGPRPERNFHASVVEACTTACATPFTQDLEGAFGERVRG
jgi:hypothetical protein